MGVALNFLMSCKADEYNMLRQRHAMTYLLERLVVDEAGGVFRYVQLRLLYVLSVLPRAQSATTFQAGMYPLW